VSSASSSDEQPARTNAAIVATIAKPIQDLNLPLYLYKFSSLGEIFKRRPRLGHRYSLLLDC